MARSSETVAPRKKHVMFQLQFDHRSTTSVEGRNQRDDTDVSDETTRVRPSWQIPQVLGECIE